jgi:hypothetical protein
MILSSRRVTSLSSGAGLGVGLMEHCLDFRRIGADA